MESDKPEIGTVVKSTGSFYQVRLADNSQLSCRIIGKFRLQGFKLTNPVAVGDRVEFIREQDEKGLIKKILPRENYIVRQSPRQKHNLHLLASNIDQAVLVLTMVNPKIKQGFIDRFLLMTEPHDIPVTLVFNKMDLYEDQDLEYFGALAEIYEAIGYQVLLTSATEKKGLKKLREFLQGKVTMISGQSGVGKSSLVTALQPQLKLKALDISNYTGKGQHSTTFAEMYTLDFGGHIIDTPGLKTLAFNNLEPMDVAHNFKEFFETANDCKFANCTHRNEPKCAVKQAIEEGHISDLRYSNYLQILEEIEDLNYWERHKEM